MPIEITMPRLSDTMQEGTLVKWRVSEGDKVSSGDVLADVETDKATMELQAFDDGTVAKLVASEGDTLAVGELIAVLAGEGESAEEAAKGVSGGGGKKKAKKEADAKPQAAEEKESEEEGAGDEQEETSESDADEPKAKEKEASGGERLRVSPVARKIAEDKGVDLTAVKGTGPDGRIIKRDVLEAAERGAKDQRPQAAKKEKGGKPAAVAPAAPMAPATLESRSIPVSNMRKTIAKRLIESKTTIPHFTVTVTVNMDPLLDLRQRLNDQLEDQGVKLSVNDFLVRACTIALVQHPYVNSTWAGDKIEQPGTVNVGVAVALPEEKGGGLVVPTLRKAHTMSLRQINSETRRLASKAREQGLTLEEMSDGTFTISNLGMMGVEHFEAIINPPQAAILAVGAATAKPVVRGGQIIIGQEMALTISCDHRVVDGAMAAGFLNTLKGLLENPAVMLV